ncbi:MAG: hypothetical protein WCQ95_01735 [Bacteroidota bacterium]
MEHRFLNWIKSYDISHNGLTHNLFIASHKEGYYNGILVYTIQNIDRTDITTQPAFRLQTEYLPDLTEEAVYNKGLERIKELFKDDFAIVEDKTNRFIKWD